MLPTTKEDTGETLPVASQRPAPGLLLVFSNGEPRHAVWRISDDGEDRDGQLVLGRDELLLRGVNDERVSRQHLRVEYRAKDATISLTDLGSRNGSVLAGEPFVANVARRVTAQDAPRILRIGKTLLIPLCDARPHEQHGLSLRDGMVVGPTLRDTQDHVALLSRGGHNILLTGESGAGKEHLARVYHAAGPGAAAPFIAINCATIPRDLAERLLFGTRRGAYSGAVADAMAISPRRTAERCFSTRLASSRPLCRPSSCACSRRVRCCRSAQRDRTMSRRGCARRRCAICARK
jgi:hypothetical protein